MASLPRTDGSDSGAAGERAGAGPVAVRRLRTAVASVAVPALAAAGGLAAAAPAGGAGHAPAARGVDTVPGADRVLEEAEDRQRGFERHRRRRLPYAGGSASARCDEIVGRYCLWHEDGDDIELAEEPRSVGRERDRLLEHLAGALDSVPGSAWLVGQRVRYLLEAGREDDALRAAARCRASDGWCRALAGRVLHEAGRFGEALEAFRAAGRAMDGGRRREWRDLSVLLEGDAADRWEESGPAERRRLARRTWRLSDPLHLVPGNDRRTEHLSRVVDVRLRRDAATPFGRTWTDGLEELTLRYGLPVEYRREPPSPSRIDPGPIVVGRHPPDALSFLPAPEAILRPGRAGEDAWELDARRPHASYAPPYADTVRRLRHELAVFPRGDTAVVVAAYRSEPARGDGAAEALLRMVPVAALDSPSTAGAASEDRREGALAGGLAVRVPPGPHLVSVEVLQRRAAVADRSRYGLRLSRRPEGVPGLSDLLLLEPGAPSDAPLEEVLPSVRGPGPVRPGGAVGVYWELYGPRLLLRDVEVSVALVEEDGGLVERIAGAVGLGDGEGVALEWRDAAARPGRVHPRGVRLRLPDDLSEGDYRVRVSVRLRGYDEMTAERRLEVRRADG
jgi:hypothetical protein